MNWIIRSTKKLHCHTNLNNLLDSSWIDISEFNWLVSDLDLVNFSKRTLPIDMRENYSILSSENFKELIESNAQIIWGVISAVSKNTHINIDENDLPFVEGNDLVWENGNLQVNNSEIEIIAFDSSYTIVKFKNQSLSEKFKKHFDEAIELDKYKF